VAWDDGHGEELVICLVVDRADLRLRLEAAAIDAGLPGRIDVLENAGALTRYLGGEGEFALFAGDAPPGLIVLDLQTPEVLPLITTLRQSRRAQAVPVIVITPGPFEAPWLKELYAAGASSVVARPPSFDGLVDLMGLLGRYWLQLVTLSA
jgi:CheY-like chemotaxis protein